LHQFPKPNCIDLTNLVEFPPKLQPVPAKPYFFDIAYNYIGLKEEPQTEKAVTTKAEEKKSEQAKKGWFW
jgi:signal recognition particle subunit SRP68